MQARAEMEQRCIDSRNLESQRSEHMDGMMSHQNYMNFNTSPQSLMEWVDHNNEGTSTHEIQSGKYHGDDISESDPGHETQSGKYHVDDIPSKNTWME